MFNNSRTKNSLSPYAWNSILNTDFQQTIYSVMYIRNHIVCMKGILIGEYFMEQSQKLNCASDLNMNDLICVLIVVSRKI